jgi:hypothetical protein
MSSERATTTTRDYRSAIEKELAERLAHSRGPEAPAPKAAAAPIAAQSQVSAPAAGVALLCLACRGTSAGDAHFCTSCGERFNALVILPRPGGRTA